jgi:hypothetical protein
VTVGRETKRKTETAAPLAILADADSDEKMMVCCCVLVVPTASDKISRGQAKVVETSTTFNKVGFEMEHNTQESR